MKLEQQLLINREWFRAATTDQQGMKLEQQLSTDQQGMEQQLLINRGWT